MAQDQNATFFNALPPVVVALTAIILGLEGVFILAEQGFIGGVSGANWRIQAVQSYGFYSGVFEWLSARNFSPHREMIRFVSYAGLHNGGLHAIFVSVIILAIGNMLGRVFSNLAIVLIFFSATLTGALAFGLTADRQALLIGADAGAYGLIGAFTWLLYTGAQAHGKPRISAFTLITVLVGIQLVFGIFFNGVIAVLIAEVAGFVAGFALAFLLRPGGFKTLLRALRQR